VKLGRGEPDKPRISAIELSHRYGELFQEVKEAFLYMPYPELCVLLDEYRATYGDEAHDYARRTIHKWRSGRVRMTGETMVRLLELVPRHLPMQKKLELVRRLRTLAYRGRRKLKVGLTIPADRSLESTLGAVSKLVMRQVQLAVPDGLTEIQGWLYAHDTQALQELLIEEEREIMYMLVADLYWNIKLGQWLRTQVPGRLVVEVRFEIPTAHVKIEIRKPRRGHIGEEPALVNPDQDVITQIVRAESDARFADGQMTAQEYVLRNIDRYFTPAQQEELRLIAAKQGLELDKMKTEVMLRGQTSAHDVEQFKKLLDDLKKSGAKADVEGNYQTPSGSVLIKAKTNPMGCTTLLLGALIVICLLAM
jgi:hypothetical protein